MDYKLATTIGGLGLLIPSAMGLLVTGYPTILHPFPAITVLPAFFLASAHLWMAGTAVPIIFFFSWSPRLWQGETRVPKRSSVLLAAAAFLSIIWFVFGWKLGLHYQGPAYTYWVCAINVAWIVILAVSIARCQRANSFASNLIFHWLLFAWLGWFAFPYLGELP
jgi:hypothetical protein